MLHPNFFNNFFVFPILNLLIVLFHGFLFLHLPGAFGFSIIALTVLVRLVLQPFFHQQMSTAKKMQDIKPHLDNLALKHKNDKQRLQQEQLKAYQAAGINPASGCVFLIIQIPIFIALYNTLLVLLQKEAGAKLVADINKVLYSPALKIQAIDPNFFGFNLALSPQHSGIWYYYIVPLVTAALQYLQVQATTPPQPAKVVVKEGEEKKSNPEDFQKVMNTQMKFIFPLLIGWFSFTLPVGLALYWNIFSIFSIIQYRNIKGKAVEGKLLTK